MTLLCCVVTLLCCDTVVLWHCCVVTLLCCDTVVLCCDTLVLCCDTLELWHCCVVTLLCCDTVVLWHCCVVTLLCCDTVVLWHCCRKWAIYVFGLFYQGFCNFACDISIERKLFIRVLFLGKKENKLWASVPILHALWTAITYWKCYGKLQSTNKNTCRIRENTRGSCFILNVS